MKQEPQPERQRELPLLEVTALITEQLQGSAVAAFCGRRIEQIIKFGHTPEKDAEQPLDSLVRQARDRLTAFLEIMGHGKDTVPPERREQLLRYIETGGACLIAAYEQVAKAPIAGFEPEDQ